MRSVLPLLLFVAQPTALAGAPGDEVAAASELVRGAEQEFGPDSPELASALRTAGATLRRKGHERAAEGHLRRLVALYEQQRPPSAALLQSLYELVQCLEAQKKYAAAEPFAVRAVAFAASLDEPSRAVWRPQAEWYLADLKNLRGAHEEAERIARRLLVDWAEADGRETAFTARARWQLARALLGQRRRAEAEAEYARVLAFEETSFPDARTLNPRVAALLDELVPLYRSTGRASEAKAAAARAQQIRQALARPASGP